MAAAAATWLRLSVTSASFPLSPGNLGDEDFRAGIEIKIDLSREFIPNDLHHRLSFPVRDKQEKKSPYQKLSKRSFSLNDGQRAANRRQWINAGGHLLKWKWSERDAL